jgi:GDPmannose 4,6-dehydratase
MLQQEQPEDFVIATGQQSSVRDFIIRAANELGITIAFEGQGLEEVGKVADCWCARVMRLTKLRSKG